MTVRWEDLPPDARRRIDGKARPKPSRRKLAGEAVASPAPLTRQARSVFASPSHRCKACHRTFTEWAPAERHVNAAHGGGVIELLI